MSTEEPAWKAELQEPLRAAMASADGFALEQLEPYDYQDHVAAVLSFIEPHIKAAEQRGREAALREAAGKIRAGKGVHYPSARLGGEGWIADAAADLIDPDKP